MSNVVQLNKRYVLELDCGTISDRESEFFGETIYFLNLRTPNEDDRVVWSGLNFDKAMEAALCLARQAPLPFLRILCEDHHDQGDVP